MIKRSGLYKHVSINPILGKFGHSPIRQQKMTKFGRFHDLTFNCMIVSLYKKVMTGGQTVGRQSDNPKL